MTVTHRVRYLRESLEEATQNVVQDLLREGGLGGAIALDLDGNGSLSNGLQFSVSLNHKQFQCLSTVKGCIVGSSGKTGLRKQLFLTMKKFRRRIRDITSLSSTTRSLTCTRNRRPQNMYHIEWGYINSKNKATPIWFRHQSYQQCAV